jgi:hypothetical protein
MFRLRNASNLWLLGWAFVAVALAAAIALGPLDGVPHVQDEVVYEFQARLLSEGRLWEEERLPRAAYPYEFIINDDGRRYGVMPNGWPLLLALGVLVGMPWLVNPLLHGLTVLAGAYLAGRIDARARWLAAPILALSPVLLVQSASRMSHTLSALLTLAAAILLLGSASRRRALLLGAVLGWLLLTRTLDGIVVTTLAATWILLMRAVPRWWPALAPLFVALLLIAAQSQILEGSVTRFPQTSWFARMEPPTSDHGWRYSEECNRLGFGPDRGCFVVSGSVGHTPGKALQFVADNVRLAGRVWFGVWPLALLLLPALLAPRLRRFGVMALSTWGGLAAAYAFYWYPGLCYGPRFHHAAAPLVLVAFALGMAWVVQRLRVPTLVGLLPMIALVWRLEATLPELERYWGVDDRLDQFERSWSRGPALMLVASGPPYAVRQPLPNTAGVVAIFPDFLRRSMWIERRGGELRYAEYHPELVATLRARHPQRPAYVLALHPDPAHDFVTPIEEAPPPPRALEDLPLPVDMPRIER